jgi:hypothetical protein
VIESAVETSGFCERHDRPAGSSMVLKRRADEVILVIPPGWHGHGGAVLDVKGKTLWVRSEDLFGGRVASWRREEIEDIRTGYERFNDNGCRLELQIHLKKFMNPTFGLLGGRSGDELAWMATVLRHALRLPQAGRRARSFTRTTGDRIRGATERPPPTSKDDRIQVAKQPSTRSTSLRPKRPKGE